jgi:TfoX/Sxy family transcriptional regulator of competence genes
MVSLCVRFDLALKLEQSRKKYQKKQTCAPCDYQGLGERTCVQSMLETSYTKGWDA